MTGGARRSYPAPRSKAIQGRTHQEPAQLEGGKHAEEASSRDNTPASGTPDEHEQHAGAREQQWDNGDFGFVRNTDRAIDEEPDDHPDNGQCSNVIFPEKRDPDRDVE